MPSFDECTAITPECPVEGTIYGYFPSMGANVFFLAWFGLLLAIFTFQGCFYRTWTFLIATFFGCLGEAVGYVGRIILHNNPWSNTGFDMQICCLIIAPAFLSGGIYLTLKHLVIGFGPQWSPIRPAWYTYIFITCDLISLILQGAGGGLAATADDQSTEDLGNNLMLAGICFQVVTLAVFAALVAWFVFRTYKHHRAGEPLSDHSLSYRNTLKFKLFLFGIGLAFVTIVIRCIYRIPEMAGGWRNSLMQNETDFIVLDGVMIAIAAASMAIFHPGFCFPQMVPSKMAALSDSTRAEKDLSGSNSQNSAFQA